MNQLGLRILLRLRRTFPGIIDKLLRRWWDRFWRLEVDENRKLQKALLGSVSFNDRCESFAGSERAELAESVSRFYPFKTLMEFGCAFGQSFHLYARLFPTVQLVGFDPDTTAIESGREFYATQRFGDRVVLEPGGLERMPELAEQWQPDVIYSSACLLYLTASEIRDALVQFYQSSRLGFVLMEQDLSFMSGSITEKSRFIGVHGANKPYWLHNFGVLCRELFPDGKIAVRKLAKPKFETELWQSCGAVVTFIK